MGLINLVLPEINKPDKTEDPKVTTALTTIQTWANGNIDFANLSTALKEIIEHTHTMETATWSVAEKVNGGIIPGGFRKLATGETQTLIGIEVELGKGVGTNSIEYNVERFDAEGTKSWAAITGLEKLKLNKEEVVSKTVSQVLHNKDRLRLNILASNATPEGLSLSAFIEHIG